ncbi:MAG: hypothetical protein HS117_06795 [Verrucomicrobiaceae bacterium]|jgi:hypothetical protein|nr:hypothetical protein [Verrucomicrobiaceae bacterium]
MDDDPSRYARLPEKGGCRRACALHFAMLGFTLVLAIIWIIRNRAWELEITVEWPW